MNKSEFSLASILGIIISVVFVWIFLFSIWYSNNILNQEKFVSTTTQVLQSEQVRNSISSQIINVVQEKRPIVGSLAAPLLTKIIAGALDSNLYANLNTKIAQEIQVQLTSANPREVFVNVRPTKDLLGPFINELDPEIMSNVPDRIVIIKKNQIPSLYKFGTYLTIGGPILLIIGLLILGLIWRKMVDNREYIFILSLTVAASGLLIYFIVPAFGNYLVAQTDSSDIALIINNIYVAFTAPISQFSLYVLVGGVFVAFAAKFAKKEIFKLPEKVKSPKK